MARLHCDVPEAIAQRARLRAEKAGLSLSRYLAELVRRDVQPGSDWPNGYFDLFGKWEGATLERGPQGIPDERGDFE